MKNTLVGALLVGFSLVATVQAETASVAVAANFTAAAEQLAAVFKADTGHEVALSFGASGALYTQITQGAPFDAFLSADGTRPAKAVAEGFGVEGSVFTYAVGSLALYSPSIDIADGLAVLRRGAFDKLAIAAPETAPYGQAAIETLTRTGLFDTLTSKIVTGQNITQALQFVDSGNAELGFVSAAQVVGRDHVWIVPAELHDPINQDAVLLKSGAGNEAAAGFLEFLKSDQAAALTEALGYTVP